MIEFGGWQFPDGEQHLIEHMRKLPVPVGGRMSYQYHKMEMALALVSKWRRAGDVGGHIGLWAHYLSAHFDHVDAFEPMPAHRECFTANIVAPNVTLHPCALGEAAGEARMMVYPGNSGASHIAKDGKIIVPMRTLDSFGFEDLDFLKIDTEGFELQVLKGATETLERCKPVIIVEQKPNNARRYGYHDRAAIPFLHAMGAHLVAERAGDYVLVWR